MKQRHMLYYDIRAQGQTSVGQDAMAELCDWPVSTACANHDAQNALKWSLLGVCSEPQVLKQLLISIESLRNSYDLLHRHLQGFIVQRLSFVPDDPQLLQVRYQFWVTVGFEADVADQMADLGLEYVEGRLRVSQRHEGRDDLIETISSLLLYTFRFQKFSDSRWCSIGLSCRTLVASLCLGLADLVVNVRADKHASDYYIHGFQQLTATAKQYAVVATMVAHVADSFLLELLEDDRVAARVDELEAALDDEIDWLHRVPEFTWQRPATLLGEPGPQLLRSWCLHAGHVARAFIHRRVFTMARSYPWALLHGDVSANLNSLKNAEPVSEPVTAKIQKLLQLGFNRVQIEQAVRLLGQIPWTTTTVEQGHGSTAIIHRLHRQYGEETLCRRAMVHMMRCLFATDPTSSAETRVEARRKALAKWQPEKISGRHIFLADCMAEAKQQAGDEMTKAVGIAVMRKHGALFRGLPAAEQFEYEARARQRVASERKDIDDALDNLVAARELRVRRLQDEELGIAEAFRVANCRFSSTDLSSLASLWNSDKYSIQGVAQLRQLAHVAPQPPAKHALDRIADFAVDETAGRSPPCPRWCVPVCRLREVFQGGVFRFTTHNENLFYLFLYATQNPLMAAFLPLEVAERVPVVETAYAVGEGILCSGPPFDHVFSVVGRTHCTGSDIAVTENTVIQVLPHAVFVDDRHVASHADFCAFASLAGRPALSGTCDDEPGHVAPHMDS